MTVDGPRPLAAGEWDQLDHVVSTVFRPSMFREYPQLFNEDNRQNLRVIGEGGRLVCHVGMVQRPAALAGCRIDVAMIGAVATLEGARGHGYASLAFQDACDTAAADGVDVMLISGGRGLYTRAGCRQVGLDWEFTLDVEQAGRLRTARPPGGGDFDLRQEGAEAIDRLSALYAAEGTRFIRRREDWEMAFACGVMMNTASDVWGIHLGETPVAYVIVHRPEVMRNVQAAGRYLRVIEFAGQRAAVLAALPLLCDRYGVARVRLHVSGSDPVLAGVVERAAGHKGTPVGGSGTLRVINFPQLMERCRPLLAERMGRAAARDLRFEADAPPGSVAGAFRVTRGDEVVYVSGLASLALFLFGSHAPFAPPDEAPSGSPVLLGDLHRALPLPSLWYGLSYV